MKTKAKLLISFGVIILILAVVLGTLGGLGFLTPIPSGVMSDSIYINGTESVSSRVTKTKMCFDFGSGKATPVPITADSAKAVAKALGIADCVIDESKALELLSDANFAMKIAQCTKSGILNFKSGGGSVLTAMLMKDKATTDSIAKAASTLITSDSIVVQIDYTVSSTNTSMDAVMVTMTPVDISKISLMDFKTAVPLEPGAGKNSPMGKVFVAKKDTLSKLSAC